MSKKTKEQAPVAAKKTKREEFSEHKAAALEQLDLAVKDGALFFHTKRTQSSITAWRPMMQAFTDS